MDAYYKSELPSDFPERNNSILFPNPWPRRDWPVGSHKTPEQDSDAWKAVMNFKNSSSWKGGDHQKFANYFGVAHNGLSKKIKQSQRRWIPPRSDHMEAEGAGSSQGEPPTTHTARHPPTIRAPSFPPAEPRRRRLTLGAETFAQVRQ